MVCDDLGEFMGIDVVLRCSRIVTDVVRQGIGKREHCQNL